MRSERPPRRLSPPAGTGATAPALALRCSEVETRAQRGADSAIGDFQRAQGRILELDPPLAAKTLACTDWVASHYI